MQFVKAHWLALASGLAALIGISLAVVGMTRDSVVQEMKKRTQLAAEIASLKSNAHNSATIDAEKERGRKFEEEYERVVRTAELINERRPLMEGVFPEPAQLETPYLFRQNYNRRMWELPHALKAGSLPGEDEIRDELEMMADQARRAAEDGTATDVPAAPSPPGMPPDRLAPPPPPAPAEGRGRLTAPPGVGGRVAPPTGRTTFQGAAAQPPPGDRAPAAVAGASLSPAQTAEARYRAAVKKARSIRVYASPETSFHVSPLAYSVERPDPAEMWYAQVSLWIQEDLVNAIAKLNDEAAQQRGGSDANVAHMPVKRIESIRVHGYVNSVGSLIPFPAGGPAAGPRPGTAGAAPTVSSFTGRRADDQFDVVRLTLTVIVDERTVLKLVDSITRTNFYQLIGLEYTAVESVDPEGYFYGEAPVVRAVLDFEGYMARKIYKAMMPERVLQDLGIAGQEAPKDAARRR